MVNLTVFHENNDPYWLGHIMRVKGSEFSISIRKHKPSHLIAFLWKCHALYRYPGEAIGLAVIKIDEEMVAAWDTVPPNVLLDYVLEHGQLHKEAFEGDWEKIQECIHMIDWNASIMED